MSVFYLDSSAWVKRYFVEPGRERIMRLFDRGERQLQDQLKMDWS